MDSKQTTQSIPPIEADQYDVSSIHFHNNFKRVQSSASSSELRLRLRTSPPTRTLHVADQCSVAANRRFGHLQNLFASLYFTASAKSFAAQFLPLVVLISDGGFSTWRLAFSTFDSFNQWWWFFYLATANVLKNYRTEKFQKKCVTGWEEGLFIEDHKQYLTVHNYTAHLNIVFNLRKLSKNI